MIAICQPTAGSSAGSRAPERSGSLRRIDEIVSELLAGYPLAAAASALLAPEGDAAPPVNGLLRRNAATGAVAIGSMLADSSLVGCSAKVVSPAEMC
ncbi:MAG TPA: hypothetical protein VHY91_00385 [Pirellulales bacterium]|jgi:hypothetical protein|nr:hypothetical protein [Pirellulales bacterium]